MGKIFGEEAHSALYGSMLAYWAKGCLQVDDQEIYCIQRIIDARCFSHTRLFSGFILIFFFCLGVSSADFREAPFTFNILLYFAFIIQDGKVYKVSNDGITSKGLCKVYSFHNVIHFCSKRHV